MRSAARVLCATRGPPRRPACSAWRDRRAGGASSGELLNRSINTPASRSQEFRPRSRSLPRRSAPESKRAKARLPRRRSSRLDRAEAGWYTPSPGLNRSPFPRVQGHMRVTTAARAAAAATLAVAVACNRGAGAPGAGMAFPPTPVKLVTVATTNVEDATEYVGTLKSLRSTTIQPQIDGQITRIDVKSGDRVAN